MINKNEIINKINKQKAPPPPNRGGRGCHVGKRQRSNTGQPLNLGDRIVANQVFAFDSFLCFSMKGRREDVLDVEIT